MDKKKMAAAMAAVYMAIKTGEEAAAAVQAPLEPVVEPVAPGKMMQMNTWGLAGRQAIMNAGNMMQMRMFK